MLCLSFVAITSVKETKVASSGWNNCLLYSSVIANRNQFPLVLQLYDLYATDWIKYIPAGRQRRHKSLQEIKSPEKTTLRREGLLRSMTGLCEHSQEMAPSSDWKVWLLQFKSNPKGKGTWALLTNLTQFPGS